MDMFRNLLAISAKVFAFMAAVGLLAVVMLEFAISLLDPQCNDFYALIGRVAAFVVVSGFLQVVIRRLDALVRKSWGKSRTPSRSANVA